MTGTRRREMHLLAYLKTGPTGMHVGAWRHPNSRLDDILEPSRYEHIARVLEAGKFDGCFFADLFGLYDIHKGGFDTYIERGGQISFLDPVTVLPLMARVTEHLGLGATLSTSFHSAYHLARVLNSLDVLSKGRIAWNVVTSATDLEAQNFGIDKLPPKELRYDIADEVLEACFALWDCWEDGVFVLDKERGVFGDPGRIRYANYVGKYIQTRGPLSIPRSPQGRPVIMQAGSSDRGRDFAARWAEAIFSAQYGEPAMKAFYDDVKGRMAARGRAPEDCKILQGMTIVLGETESIAQEKAEHLNSLIDPELALAANSSGLAVDLAKVGQAQVADARGNQGMDGTQQRIEQQMREDGLTFDQVVRRGARSMVVGTAPMVADRMQALFEAHACDGFVLAPTIFPGMFEDIATALVPELQRRGIFRKDYTGRTLRENLRGPAPS
ncbi:LLM class flavin-dependent oxidoreductase [Roseomonas sp. HJA6]|uniref:LLM class flavin-dependent oxidoreductase n=1 Tax=Roseomonas alba TaxID=2846776 RepID=A0ABS7AHT2_9PROT|nr:LLM class flavin-dependent oxidoreductase [Neoroseomonas alba]MBW6401610.1 LLM class flavin-dependent oxidoreductase [Neoroseomonas alba]